jgi:acyl-CoA thioesterase-1
MMRVRLFSSVAIWLLFAVSEGLSQMQSAQVQHPAMDPVSTRDGFPQVLLIGDSISIDYTLHVRGLLNKVADVHRPLVNCESTIEGLREIDRWLGAKRWAVIHFNWGLHDLKYENEKGEGALPPAGKQKVLLPQYEKNLRALVERLKRTGARLIFATTTPVPDGTIMRIRGEEDGYNRIAVALMSEYRIPVDDLHAFVVPRAGGIQRPRNVHFTPEGSMLLAREVAASILAALGISREEWSNK